MLICCPDCVDQHLDATRGPLDPEQQELAAFVNRLEMFIGVENPWSLITATMQGGTRN